MLGAVILIGLAIFAIPAFFDPAFEVVNQTDGPVYVIAEWRTESREIGSIEALSSYEFSVDDEAAMVFRVRFADGSEAESEPIYFSRGFTVIATISGNSVEVAYDHDS